MQYYVVKMAENPTRYTEKIRISFNFGQITHVTIFINNHSIVQRFAHLGFFRYTQLKTKLIEQCK